MIEIKCTEKEKDILKQILLGSYENSIKWDIQPESLKPCPFCGGEAKLLGKTMSPWRVRCEKCGTSTITESKKYVITRWNNRVKD